MGVDPFDSFTPYFVVSEYVVNDTSCIICVAGVIDSTGLNLIISFPSVWRAREREEEDLP
jgi:hypothetical protein